MNIMEVCRLCLAKSSKTCDEIFFPIDEDFEKKFEEVTNILLDIQSEAYPSLVCVSCVNLFEDYYNYRKRIIEKQKRLNLLLGIRNEHIENPSKSKIESSSQTIVYKEVEETEDCESQSQHEEVIEETEQTVEYQENEGEYVQSEGSEIINFEEVAEGGQQEYDESQFEYEESQQENEVYQEETEEYVDSADEYIEEMDQNDGEERFLFAIDEDSELNQIEGNCIIIKSEEASGEGEPHKKRKYKKSNSKDKPYKCWEANCTAAFTHRSSLNKHLLLAHSVKCDKSTCMMCGRKFSQYSDFLSHVKKHTRKSECDICKLTFVTEEKMLAHRARVHTNDSNDRSFKCHLCEAMFKRKEHLNSHITYRHTDHNAARRFPCSDCSSTFLTRQDLKNHLKSHTQQKKYCAYCNYDCRDLKSIKLHCLKMHGTTKIYKCGCDDAFELFKELQLHKKNCYRMVDSTTKLENDD